MKAETTEVLDVPMQMCNCKQKCEQALSWASRAPMNQCYPDDAECQCWCHELGNTERERAKRTTIWYFR